jgi:hypothetical protein
MLWSLKKLALLSKFSFAKFAKQSQKRKFFRRIFRRKYLKIITSVPDLSSTVLVTEMDYYILRKRSSLGRTLQAPEQSYVLRTGLWAQFLKSWREA